MTEDPVLRGEHVMLRSIAAADVAPLMAIYVSDEVSHWWVSPPDFDDDDAVIFAIEKDGDLIGLLQYYEEATPEYRSAGMDIFLAASEQGRGLGADALRTLARHLFEERGHHRLTIDPAAANARAIACYRKVGFKPVGVMRQYERGRDGTWHDGLLMDLLQSELT